MNGLCVVSENDVNTKDLSLWWLLTWARIIYHTDNVLISLKVAPHKHSLWQRLWDVLFVATFMRCAVCGNVYEMCCLWQRLWDVLFVATFMRCAVCGNVYEMCCLWQRIWDTLFVVMLYRILEWDHLEIILYLKPMCGQNRMVAILFQLAELCSLTYKLCFVTISWLLLMLSSRRIVLVIRPPTLIVHICLQLANWIVEPLMKIYRTSTP